MKTKIGFPAFVLAALLFLGLPLASSSGYVAVSVGIAPPAIPYYEQPLCPGPGYIWTPGYWAWGDFGYYWVPGVWVIAPQVGYYWTPGYWGFNSGHYIFHDGYWGPSVGYYGGINYGYGYYGSGYYGGRWAGNTFTYNTAVTRVNPKVVTHTYVNREVVQNTKGPRPSFNGPGGVKAKPTQQQLAAAKGPHRGPTATQRSLLAAAKNDPSLHAKNNYGQPKADAVRNFETKHRPNAAERTAATRKNERGARQAATQRRNQPTNRNTADNRMRSDRPTGVRNPANRTANRSHAPARKKQAASSQANRGTPARHSASRKVANGSHATHHNNHAATNRGRVASHRLPKATHHQRVASHARTIPHRAPVASHQRHTSSPNRHAIVRRQGAAQHQGRTAENNGHKRKKHGGNGG